MGSAALTGVTVVGSYLCRAAGTFPLLLYAVVPACLGLGISAVTAGLLERGAKRRTPALIVSTAAAVATIAAIHLLLWNTLLSQYGFLLYLIIPVTAALAGVTAIDVKAGRMKTLPPLLVLWFTPLVLNAWIFVALPSRNTTGAIMRVATAVFGILSGPWAGLLTTVFKLPRSWNLFSPPLALALTAALAAAAVAVLRAKNRCSAGLGLIAFATVALAWFAMGFGQLVVMVDL